MPRLITFADWKRKLRDEIWPSGYPENLTNVIDRFFVAGCMDLQRVIDCLKENNANIYPFCATWFNAGLTFVNAPSNRAYIKRVYTIANGDWTNKVFYHQQDYRRLADWSQNLLLYVRPQNLGVPALPMGDRWAEKTTDRNIQNLVGTKSDFGRSRHGIWAINRRRIYLGPWIQSNESVVIEWDGVRSDWNDTDMIDQDVWDTLYEEALKLFVKVSYERDFGDRTDKATLESDYNNKVALLINDCTDQLRQRSEEGVPMTYTSTSAELTAEKIPDETVPAIAIIGGYGSDDSVEAALSTLVNSWSPLAIITNGGNNAGDTTLLSEWDRRVGKYFNSYIFPYTGSWGPGALTNKFWPAMGLTENATRFAEFFQSTRQPQYDVVVGSVHFFIVHGASDYTEQMQWLQASLALSTARWKVVVINATADIDQPFDTWGSHLVIYGRAQAYNRTPDRIEFAVTGAPVALKLSASCTALNLLAYSADGTQIDTLTIT